MKPRICMVVMQDYLTDGRVRRYAESLADHGAQVDILCVQGARHFETAYRDDIRIHRIPLSRSATSLVGFIVEYSLAVLLFSVWMMRLHIRNRYRAIHVHNMPDFLIACGLLPRLLGAKLLLDVHDPMPEFYASKYDTSTEGWLVKLLRLQERISAWCANGIITANDNFKQNLIARGTPADKVVVVNNIPDVKLFDRRRHPRQIDASGQRRFTLLFPGTLAPRYGLHVPIHAAVQLRHDIPDLLIRIVGPHNEYADELVQLAHDLGVEEHVELLPEVPVHDVPGLMASADIGIYPARFDPHMDIATPTKVLEFMQMGLPVIASRLRVLEQQFDRNTVRYCQPGNIDEFATAVKALWSDAELRQSLADNADRGFVRKRAWPYEQAVYFGLLDQLLNTALAASAKSEPQSTNAYTQPNTNQAAETQAVP